MDEFQSSFQPFRPYLLPGERILWTGKPKQGLVLRPTDAFLIPFSLVWTGFVISAFLSTIHSVGSPDVILVPFLALGLYFTIGRFIHDAVIRRRTSYAVTDQRVLFGRGLKVTSLDLRHLPKLELSERPDGSGTIAFQDNGFATFNRYSGFNWWVPSMVASTSFLGIQNARDVYRIIRENSGRSSTF